MKTVLEIITSTTDYFRKNSVESPRLNIEHLLAHVLGKKRMDLYMEFDRPLGESELEPLRALVKRRAAGEPLQHLLGTWDFCGHTLLCDARALIPRQETEELCEKILKSGPAQSFVDIGTGTGAIALTLAAAWPEAQAEAVDISEDAIALARQNATALGLDARVRFLHGDLLASVEGTRDLIVANLPYISSGEIPKLSREVQRDPVLALDGGGDGLRLIERLAGEAPRVLRGRLALEIGCDQSERVVSLLAAWNFRDIRIDPDYQGRPRFVFAHYG